VGAALALTTEPGAKVMIAWNKFVCFDFSIISSISVRFPFCQSYPKFTLVSVLLTFAPGIISVFFSLFVTSFRSHLVLFSPYSFFSLLRTTMQFLRMRPRLLSFATSSFV
jgi:hypothetical protein